MPPWLEALLTTLALPQFGLSTLFVIAFVDTVGAALVVPILPFYATRYGASAALVGLLFGVTHK